MDVWVCLGMCLLMPFLPSCLLKIYLELKQAGHGGRERLFTQRGGNRTQALALLLLPSAQPPSCIFPEHPRTPVISRFYSTDSHQSQERSYLSANLCVCWCGCMYSMSCADDSPTHFSAFEHVFNIYKYSSHRTESQARKWASITADEKQLH